MAKINGGKGFENFDIEAYKIEQEILKKEREQEEKELIRKGRPRMPRINSCIYCDRKFSERTVKLDFSECETLDDILCAIDDADEDLSRFICKECNSFFGVSLSMEGFPSHYPGWMPEDAIKRLNEAKEKGYANILKSQKFFAPSGNVIEVEFGDIFPIKRVSVDSTDKGFSSKDFYSIDIMVSPDKLTLFPWEFGTISWTELMMELRDGTYETVYLENDVEGYYEPVPEIRELFRNTFGDR